MKHNLLKMTMAFGSLLLLASCAHKEVEQRLALKMSEETAVKSAADLGREVTLLRDRRTELTPKQKTELADLQTRVHNDLGAIRKQSLKLRAILIIDLMNPDYDDDEVELIKSKLAGLEKQKLTVYSEAVSATNKILGRLDSKDVRIMNEMIRDSEAE